MRIAALLLAIVWISLPASISAQDSVSVWKALETAAFDSEKAADVRDIALSRDRIRITLIEGRIQFTPPVRGVVFGAAFRGKGRVKVTPPTAPETQQVWLHTGQETLDLEFTDAAFVFSDETFDQIGRGATWRTEPGTQLAEIYADRQRQREECGAELLPRLFRSIVSADRSRSSFFFAELKTEKKGWIYVGLDALAAEDVQAGQWKLWDGGARRPDAWLEFPAGGRSAAEAFREPLAKADFLIRSTSIDTEVDGTELIATARVSVQRIAPGLRVLVFMLDSNLRVESVSDESGRKLEFFQPRDPKDRTQSYGDYIAVALPEPAARESTASLEFRYRGKRVIRRVGQGQFFCQSFGWYPTIQEAFATRSDFELKFKVPKKYSLVATGAKTAERVEDNFSVSTWKSEVPIAVAGFAFGDYRVETMNAGNVTVEVYANKEADDQLAGIEQYSGVNSAMDGRKMVGPALGSLSPSVLAKMMVQEVVNSVNVFASYFGPFPYRRLAVTNIPYSYGQGWPSLLYLSALSFLDSTQRNALGLSRYPEITDFFRAHETSHQWWGHLIGWNSYHDQWLSEGFAQFSGNLYVQARQNSKEYLGRLRRDKEGLKSTDQRGRRYESLGPIWMGERLSSSDAPQGYQQVVYNKGGLVVHMLRMMLQSPRNPQGPDAAFSEMMKDFCSSYGGKTASTEDFKAVVEKHMVPAMDLDKNRRMDWFFNQYVYGTGIPEYRLEYRIESMAEGRWKAAGKIVQDKVSGDWKDILPLYVHAGGKSSRAAWLRATGPETPFEIFMPFKPDSFSINDGEEILAEIK
jgi:hypothetical protein